MPTPPMPTQAQVLQSMLAREQADLIEARQKLSELEDTEQLLPYYTQVNTLVMFLAFIVWLFLPIGKFVLRRCIKFSEETVAELREDIAKASKDTD